MYVYLETERLTLRQLTQADVDNLFALDSDPAVMRYLSGGTPTPRDVIAHEILPRCLTPTSATTATASGQPSRRPAATSWDGSLPSP